MCFNKRRTVLALTRIFRRCSWRAIFRMARRDHFRSRMGSPPVSWRSRWAMALITAGFFFYCFAPTPGLAHALPLHLPSQQLPPSTGHRVHVQSQKLCDLPVAAVAYFVGLQPCIETPLPLIQQTVKQNDRRFQFRRQLGLHRRFLNLLGCWPSFPPQALFPFPLRLRREVDVHICYHASVHPMVLIKLEQGLFDFHTQEGLQLAGRKSCGGLLHEALCGGQQSPVARKPDPPRGPKSLFIELRDLRQGVVL